MRPIIKICLFLFLMTFFFGSSALAEPVVVTCEGKYGMGDLDSKKDARTLALMEAKRVALEKAGTYLESSSVVKNYELTKDQINSLAAGTISVEILKEDWKMSGENLMLTVLIRATIDNSNLEERISTLKEDKESVEDLKKIQTQMAALQKELNELKARQAEQTSGGEGEKPQKELKRKHTSLVKELTALEHLKKANADLANHRWTDAMAGYSQALSADPKMANAYIGQAISLQRRGEPIEALKKIDSALEIAPGKARAHAVKSLILADLQRCTQAMDSINKAIEINPKNPKFYLFRGGINLRLQRSDVALKDFKYACKMGNRKACENAKKLARRLKTKSRSPGR